MRVAIKWPYGLPTSRGRPAGHRLPSLRIRPRVRSTAVALPPPAAFAVPAADRHRHPSHPPSSATTGFPGSALLIPRQCRPPPAPPPPSLAPAILRHHRLPRLRSCHPPPLSARSPLSPATAGTLAIPRHQYRPLTPPTSAIHYPAAAPGY